MLPIINPVIAVIINTIPIINEKRGMVGFFSNISLYNSPHLSARGYNRFNNAGPSRIETIKLFKNIILARMANGTRPSKSNPHPMINPHTKHEESVTNPYCRKCLPIETIDIILHIIRERIAAGIKG